MRRPSATQGLPWGTLALCLAATACGLPEGEYFGKVPEVGDPKHVRWCNSGQPESLDPGQASSTTATPIIHALFDGLTIFGDDGLPEKSLATHWDVAPDQRRVTFHMRRDARFSDLRPVTAYDIVYQGVRTLHPLTASPSADGLDFLKGYEGYLDGSGRVLLRDAGGLPAGTLVEIVTAAGKDLATWRKERGTPPDPNRRAGRRPLALRDLGAAVDEAYATVPAGSEVTIVELSGRPASLPSPDAVTWAYVHWNRGQGLYGWVPRDELDVGPHDDAVFTVRPVPKQEVPGLDASLDELAADARLERAAVTVRGADLLALPEQLGLRAPDPYTVVIEAATPTPHIVLTTPSRVLRAVPRDAVSRRPRRWAEPGTIVTSGPLHLVDMAERDYLELVRSPTYWNQEAIKLDRLTIYSLNDQSSSANVYYTGGCDATTANHMPATLMPLLSGAARGGKPFADFSISPYLGSYFILVNLKKFDNVHFRRALALSLDRTLIPTFLKGGEIASSSYIPGTPIGRLSPEELALCGVTADTPGTALIVEAGKQCYVPARGLDFDPEAARAELAKAKQEMGARFPRHITYKFNSNAENNKIIAEFVQAQWKAVLGLDVTLESQEWQVYLSDTRIGEYEVARLGWIGSSPSPESEFMNLYRCSSRNNRPKWCNQDFERIMDEASVTLDPVARLAKIREAEALLLSEAPIIPLYTYTQKNLQRPYLRGLAQNPIAQPPLWKAWRDPNWRTNKP